MRSIKTTVSKLLLISTTYLIVSCGSTPVEFDPQFKVGDPVRESIVNRFGEETFCHEPSFKKHACLTEEKIKELREILRKAVIPDLPLKTILDSARKKQLKYLDNAIKRMEDE